MTKAGFTEYWWLNMPWIYSILDFILEAATPQYVVSRWSNKHFELAAADYCPFFITAVDKNYGYLALKCVSSLNNMERLIETTEIRSWSGLNYNWGWQLPPCCTISCTTFTTNRIQKQFRFTDRFIFSFWAIEQFGSFPATSCSHYKSFTSGQGNNTQEV